MVYAIWIGSFVVGLGLMQTSPPVGWLVIVAGALIGYRLGRKEDREDQARRIGNHTH